MNYKRLFQDFGNVVDVAKIDKLLVGCDDNSLGYITYGQLQEVSGGNAKICGSVEELDALDASEGALAIVQPDTSITDGKTFDGICIDITKTPVFDELTESETDGVLIAGLYKAGTAIPFGAIVYGYINNAYVLYFSEFETARFVYLYSSKEVDTGNGQLSAGWQPGIERVEFSEPATITLSGVFVSEMPNIRPAIVNFNDIFTTISASSCSLYSSLGGDWKLIAQPTDAQKKTEDINIPMSIITLTSEATSDQIIEAFGGRKVLENLFAQAGNPAVRMYLNVVEDRTHAVWECINRSLMTHGSSDTISLYLMIPVVSLGAGIIFISITKNIANNSYQYAQSSVASNV